jgi:hypothetical protein
MVMQTTSIVTGNRAMMLAPNILRIAVLGDVIFSSLIPLKVSKKQGLMGTHKKLLCLFVFIIYSTQEPLMKDKKAERCLFCSHLLYLTSGGFKHKQSNHSFYCSCRKPETGWI